MGGAPGVRWIGGRSLYREYCEASLSNTLIDLDSNRLIPLELWTTAADIPSSTDRVAKIGNLLWTELKRQGVTYAQLVDRFVDIGVIEKEVDVRNELSRGRFEAGFMLLCLEAIAKGI